MIRFILFILKYNLEHGLVQYVYSCIRNFVIQMLFKCLKYVCWSSKFNLNNVRVRIHFSGAELHLFLLGTVIPYTF